MGVMVRGSKIRIRGFTVGFGGFPLFGGPRNLWMGLFQDGRADVKVRFLLSNVVQIRCPTAIVSSWNSRPATCCISRGAQCTRCRA